jgi:DNA-binding transcriptional ArsR family regulator
MVFNASPVIICFMRAFKHPALQDLTLERVLYALSDPVRLEIIRYLADVPEATCGELDGGRPKSSMSHHFRAARCRAGPHPQRRHHASEFVARGCA